MTIIARSKKHLYINSNGWLLSIMLNHSEAQIANDFSSLPLYTNEDEVRLAHPELK